MWCFGDKRRGRPRRVGQTRARRMRQVVALLATLVWVACDDGRSGSPSPPPAPPPPLVSNVRTIKDAGGRVDWSAARNLIAFDRAGSDGFYDVYTMNPDGSDERCLTCDKAALPNKHIGNPAWHPSGSWIVFQAQNRSPGNDDLATPGAGIRNEIWVMDAGGTRFFQVTALEPFQAGVLHPVFSHRGDRLLWAERIAPAPGPYGQWALKLADFRVTGDVPRVENVLTLRPGQQQAFYESHGFTADDRKIIFSGNLEPGQEETGIDVYTLDLGTNALANLTNTMTNWDEHAQISPGGGKILWMSSMQSASPLLTDYWLMNVDGSGKERITFFNQAGSAQYIPGGVTSADSSWSPDGTRIIAYVITSQQARSGRIVMLELSRAVGDEAGGTPGDLPSGLAAGPRATASAEAESAAPRGATATGPILATRPVMVMPRTPGDMRAWDTRVDRLVRQGELVRVEDTADTLMPGRRHERFVQVHCGVPVFGADLARQTEAGRTVSIFGALYPAVDLDVTPLVSDEEVRAALERDSGAAIGPARRPRLVSLPSESGFALVYQIRVASAADLTVSFIDARTGRALASYSDLQAQQIAATGDGGPTQHATPMGGAFYALDAARAPGIRTADLRGDLSRTLAVLNGAVALGWSDTASDVTPSWRDDAVAGAHVNAGLTYDFLLARFGRAGLAPDVPIVNIVHPIASVEGPAARTFEAFTRLAFYAGGGTVVYGDGPLAGASRRPLSSALDIVAHELAHGVIEYSSRLIYRGESGALNEAFGDMLAAAVEFANQPPGAGPGHADYLIGEDVLPRSGVRSLADPSAFGQAAHYDRRHTGDADNGGVHVNAGIASHAFYLAIEGGRPADSPVGVEGVGAERRGEIERVFYRAFVFLLPANATFAMAREATLQAARDLYGTGGVVERSVAQAWAAVGVR